MKDIVQKAKSFITFDFPVNRDYISEKFATTHSLYAKDIPHWSTNATRKKVIASYWFSNVLLHFVFLFGLPALLLLITSPVFNPSLLSVIFLAGMLSFLIVTVCVYWPIYFIGFLPRLDTVKEIYERKQLEQLDKCKRAQLSNPALVLIYYVYDKVSGTNSLQCNDHYAALLMKLYGVDQGSMKKNLELILGKKKTLSQRKYTEMQNRFQEAQSFFEELQFPEGLRILNQLEQKFKTE